LEERLADVAKRCNHVKTTPPSLERHQLCEKAWQAVIAFLQGKFPVAG
jgi:hypothetical protein